MLETSVTTIPFPPDAKIRVSIEGLAYCNLGNVLTEINFLRNAQYHELSLRVIKRSATSPFREITNTVYQLPNTGFISVIPENNKVTQPGSFRSLPLRSGEFRLDEIINLRDLHGRVPMEAAGAGIPLPTTLQIRHCAFYTREFARFNHKLFEIPRPGDPPVLLDPNKRIGYVMSGKIKSAVDDMIVTITSSDLPGGKLELKGTDAGNRFVYDVIFSNHCVGAQCQQAPNDFDFYYGVLQDPQTPGRRFRIEPIPIDDEEVAACNPVITSPPFQP